MSADTTPGDVVEFNDIKFSPTNCIFKGEHGQLIFRGSFKDPSSGLAPEEREAAIIVFQKCSDADAVPPEAGQTFINQNFDRVISHEKMLYWLEKDTPAQTCTDITLTRRISSQDLSTLLPSLSCALWQTL